MACPLCDVVNRCRDGSHPGLIATLPECHVVLGDNQGCAGWCVLVLREHAEHLDELAGERQQAIFGEVSRVAGAIRRVFPASGAGGGPPRINYECLGNQVHHIHWHVIPRHADDPDARNAVWGWPAERLRGAIDDAARAALIARLRAEIAGA